MADASICIGWVLPHEAGTPPNYGINPDPTQADPNAQVCAGINSHWYPDDFAAIIALPEDQRAPAVDAFYQRVFWSKWLAGLTSNAIAAYVLDAEVNESQRIGADLLEEAVDACGANVAVDGSLGPRTVAAANTISPAILLPALQNAREDAYRRIGGPNLKGWLARAALTPPFA